VFGNNLYLLLWVFRVAGVIWLHRDIDLWQEGTIIRLNKTCLLVEVWLRFISLAKKSHALTPSHLLRSFLSCSTHVEYWLAMRMHLSCDSFRTDDKIESQSTSVYRLSGVKMTGYWPSSCFVSLRMKTDLRSVNIYKNLWGEYLDATGFVNNQTKCIIATGKDCHLVCTGSQSQHRIWFLLLAHRASHIPIICTLWPVNLSCADHCSTKSFCSQYYSITAILLFKSDTC